jgi:hypothetical protein
MKIIHRIKAAMLRRRLIRQRAENIRDLLAGRRAAKAIKIELAREIRLSGFQERSAIIEKNTALPSKSSGIGRTAGGALNGQISAILRKIHIERGAA